MHVCIVCGRVCVFMIAVLCVLVWMFVCFVLYSFEACSSDLWLLSFVPSLQWQNEREQRVSPAGYLHLSDCAKVTV